MNPFSSGEPTAGERRGLILLLAIILIVIAGVAVYEHCQYTAVSGMQGYDAKSSSCRDSVVSDSILKAFDSATENNVGNTKVSSKRRKVQLADSLRKKRKTQPQPLRNPRDERVD